MRWIIYNILFAIAYTAMMPKFLRRMKKRGGYRAHFAERFGRYEPDVARKLSEKPRIWVHAVSVGEANLAGTIIKELRRRDPSASFVISTTSSTGRTVIERLAGPDDVAIYLPLDFPRCVRRAVATVNAKAIVLAESEFWPNLLRSLSRKGVPIVLANGRVSDRSAPGYRRLRFFFGPVFSLFDSLLVQSALDRDRLVSAGAPSEKIIVTGSVKFDVAPPSAESLARAKALLEAHGVEPGRDTILLGGSTWPGEEEALAQAWKPLHATDPHLKLVLVPRHAERASEVAQTLADNGFAVRPASGEAAPNAPEGAPEILLVDLTGVLFPLYAFADVVFVGKTLAPNEGGQNMIEPCSLGKAVVCGPHVENFVPVMESLRAADAICEVSGVENLAVEIARLVSDPNARATLGAKAEEAVASSRGALARTADAIEKSIHASA